MSVQNQTPSTDLIAVAAIIFGFGITVFMFRIQREIAVKEKGWPNWIAWADYLVLFSIGLGLLAVVILLVIGPAKSADALASAACTAALVLQAGYLPAILAHYRIEIGKNRTGPREKGEPAERRFVYVSALIAVISVVLVLFRRLRSPF